MKQDVWLKKERKTRKDSWFLILGIGLCLFCMTPRTEIIKERHVNHLRETANQQTCLKRKWISYTLLSPTATHSLSLSSDTGQMIQLSGEWWITCFEILFRTVQCLFWSFFKLQKLQNLRKNEIDAFISQMRKIL